MLKIRLAMKCLVLLIAHTHTLEQSLAARGVEPLQDCTVKHTEENKGRGSCRLKHTGKLEVNLLENPVFLLVGCTSEVQASLEEKPYSEAEARHIPSSSHPSTECEDGPRN